MTNVHYYCGCQLGFALLSIAIDFPYTVMCSIHIQLVSFICGFAVLGIPLGFIPLTVMNTVLWTCISIGMRLCVASLE
jgi:hypothetical protein